MKIAKSTSRKLVCRNEMRNAEIIVKTVKPLVGFFNIIISSTMTSIFS